MDALPPPFDRFGAGAVRVRAAGARLSRGGCGLSAAGGAARMMRASHKQPGFLAALLHRLAGIALAIFLPIHFWVLSGALNGADVLDKFLKVTDTPLVKFTEGGIVVALALHMALGLRVLAIEFLPMRERTRVAISICLAAGFAVGLAFLLNVV